MLRSNAAGSPDRLALGSLDYVNEIKHESTLCHVRANLTQDALLLTGFIPPCSTSAQLLHEWAPIPVTLSCMDNEVRRRLRWVQLFDELQNCAQVCLRCGISKPTLRKWLKRYRQCGLDGLITESRRPFSSPAMRISDRERAWIVDLRARGLGSRRIQSELKRSHDFDVSRPTIKKVLRMCAPRPRLVRPAARKGSKRYAKEIPGERIQMDTCKIGFRCEN